jgi:hypothetical protein
MEFKERFIEMLENEAKDMKSKALLTLELMSNKPVGIGDHSTEDFYKNASSALGQLVEADDRLKAISEYLKYKG